MIITIVTIFPEFFEQTLQSSILKRAQHKEQAEMRVINLRDFTTDKHRTTDDRPFGGGAGMVMKVEPIAAALQAIDESLPKDAKHYKILTSAKGNSFTQARAVEYSQLDAVTIVCGHYEGVDERVAEYLVDEEVRIGDFVLTGGEPAALVMTDAITRLIPGVLGNQTSLQDESHTIPGDLAYPQYTRPEEFNGWRVPEVLLGGDHKTIAAWRTAQRKKI
jgi:tRNA (guanine37-N1)-methyltransferase